MASHRCGQCGAAAKVFPDDFPNTRASYWPSATARDGPSLVCGSCGHDEALPAS